MGATRYPLLRIFNFQFQFFNLYAVVYVAGHFAEDGAEGHAEGVEELEGGVEHAEEYLEQGAAEGGDHLGGGYLAVAFVAVEEEGVDAGGAAEEDHRGDEQVELGWEGGEVCVGEGKDEADGEQQD